MPRKTMPPGPGRPKGSKNKAPAELRAMILQALEGAGGVEYLQRQAEDNPGPFMSLVGKVLPKEVEAKVEGGLVIHWALPRCGLDG